MHWCHPLQSLILRIGWVSAFEMTHREVVISGALVESLVEED
jgi:hypothetical protein